MPQHTEYLSYEAKDTLEKTLANNVRLNLIRLRQHNKITFHRIGLHCGVTDNVCRRWFALSGGIKGIPATIHLKLLSDIFGCTVNDLLQSTTITSIHHEIDGN